MQERSNGMGGWNLSVPFRSVPAPTPMSDLAFKDNYRKLNNHRPGYRTI